ncbi:MAG: hypothetical protein HZA93_24725 [Verrucomicrobia bacterium]|nr:hypothetical protein [Verrucomicrobiota bacterium]
MLVRAIGPALQQFGVGTAMTDPQLTLLAGSTVVATNDNWAGATALSAAFAQVGAFPLPAPTSRDSVLITTFEPGACSARITGVASTTGEVLLEIYELP